MNIEVATLITRDKVNRYLSPSFKFLVIGDEGGYVWESPEGSAIKLNCDGSWFPESRTAGFGCIATDGERSVVGVRAGPLADIYSSLEAEGVSMSCNGLLKKGGRSASLRPTVPLSLRSLSVGLFILFKEMVGRRNVLSATG